MRQVHGLLGGNEICRDLSRDGNSFYVDDGSTCGIVYFSNVKKLRKAASLLNAVPNGQCARLCGTCGLFRGCSNTQACDVWIRKLLQGVDIMFVPVKMPGDLFSEKSYVAKVVGMESRKIVKREFQLLKRSFYSSSTMCELEIDAHLFKKGEFLCIKLIWGKAARTDSKDVNARAIRENFYQIVSEPSESKSFLECLRKITFENLQMAFSVSRSLPPVNSKTINAGICQRK